MFIESDEKGKMIAAVLENQIQKDLDAGLSCDFGN